MSQSNLPFVKTAIIYTRTSTTLASQDVSAEVTQPQELQKWAAANGYEVLGTFTDRASGKTLETREGLQKAIQAANKTGSVILVTELSRLSRSVKHTAEMLESNTKFIVTRSGRHVSKEMLLISAVFNAAEVDATSRRVSAGIQAKFERDPKAQANWGNTKGVGLDKARAERTNKANEKAASLGSMVAILMEQGQSMNAIAQLFNSMELKTPSGRGTWSHKSVSRVLKRYKALQA